MGQIKLTKTGFKYYEHDRKDPQFDNLEHGYDNGKYLIIEKDTGKTVASYDSEVTRADYWHAERPLPHLLACLKQTFQTEPGVTFNDFLQALHPIENVLQLSIAPRLQHDYWEYQGENIPDTLVIRRHVDTSKDFFRFIPETNGPTPVYYGDLPLMVDPKVEICGIPVTCDFTFLEAIHALLGMETEQVRVQKDGFYDGDGVSQVDPMEHLMSYCDFDPDVTLLDLFNMVSNHSLLKNIISIYSNAPHINAYHRAAREKPHEIIDFYYLEVYESGHIIHKRNHIWGNFGNPVFHGIAPLESSEAAYYDEHPEKERPATSCMAIEYLHPSVIAHLPIRLTTEYIIWYNKKNTEKVFTGNKKFTLLEALDAIYDEVTFFGLPSIAAIQLAEMREQVDAIRKIEEKIEEDNEEKS